MPPNHSDPIPLRPYRERHTSQMILLSSAALGSIQLILDRRGIPIPWPAEREWDPSWSSPYAPRSPQRSIRRCLLCSRFTSFAKSENQAEGFTWRLSPRVAPSSQTPPTAEIQYIASRAVLSQPVAMVNKDARIVIVGGAGTMGSSTALHLARRGYTDVRVLDMFQPPSANSAGNDMNKVCAVAQKA